ncbi:MAG: LuxR C-terminal-related transcriptional regulator [Crocinitomicaceae bacterium]
MLKLKETTLYSSKHLDVRFNKKNSLFIQEWNHNLPVPLNEFRNELLAFKELIKIHRPKSTIWLQEDFSTILKFEDNLWIEKNVNEECLQYGLKKCAFVVGKNVMAQLHVFNFFDKVQSCIAPRHFSEKDEALNWILYDELTSKAGGDEIQIEYGGKTADGKSQYTFKTSSKNTEVTLKSFNILLKENAFMKENAIRFFSLTNREKEIFQLYANGANFKTIAAELFLSELTIRTHWRNTKKKLAIKSLSDITDYKNSFLR